MTSAIRKVGIAFRDLLDAATTAAVFYDRGPDEPLGEEEGDTIAINVLGDDISQGIELSGTQHRVTYQVTIMARTKAGETRDEACERIAGEIVAAVGADRSLGSRVASVEEQGYVPAQKAGQDSTDAQMEFLAVFFTPRGDFNTIVGQGGQQF